MEEGQAPATRPLRQLSAMAESNGCIAPNVREQQRIYIALTLETVARFFDHKLGIG